MSEEVKTVLDELGSKFEDFKSENKTRLDEIEKKGHADPLLQDKAVSYTHLTLPTKRIV